MALSSTTLSAALRAAMLAKSCNAVDGTELTEYCDALAETIVAHIVANMEVLIEITDVGLQTSTAPSSPTAGPASQKTLKVR